MPEIFVPQQEGKEKFGSNVKIDIRFLRHGERTKTGELTDFGRGVTKEKAAQHMIEGDYVDIVKPVGSNAGPKNLEMGRALETAKIFAEEIDGSAGRPKEDPRLSYESIKSPMPYNHVEIYNSFLPADFETLPDKDKADASKMAQKGTIDHLMKLDTPEANAYKQETAGAFASFVLHYRELSHRMKPDSNVKIVAGTHGGTMEFLLQQAMVSEKDGVRKVGFNDVLEIGGEFAPSESYNVIIQTDENGEDKAMWVMFDDEKRPQTRFELDESKVKELASFYEELHIKQD